MDKLQAIVATNKIIKPLELILKMNIDFDCVIAKQGLTTNYAVINKETFMVKVIETNTKGIGINRNIGLMYAESTYCIFSDDDVSYSENIANLIVSAFQKVRKADILIFNINTVGSKVKRRYNNKIEKINRFNYQNYGAVRIAFKREAVIKNNVWFTTLFGGGCRYSSGEDTIFLYECLRKGLQIYTYPLSLGTVDQSSSSWFEGYTDKFYFDKGALQASIYKKTYFLRIIFVFALRYKIKFNGKYRMILTNMLKGAKEFRRGEL